MTITEVGVKFKVLSRYHLKDYTHDKNMSSEKFILNFIQIYNEKYFTMDGDQSICPPKLARSIEDIYRITKFYYPRITLKTLMSHLAKWVHLQEFNVLFCAQIKKRVFNIKYAMFNSFGEKDSQFFTRYKGLEIGQDEHGFTGEDYLNLIK